MPLALADDPLIWASMGGSYRAFAILAGYANLFCKAGLISTTSSKFTAISTTSSATWFSSQFFFSQQFFERALTKDIDAFSDFVIQWLASANSVSNVFVDLLERGLSSLLADFKFNKEVSLYLLLENQLERASTDYGDPYFVKRPASAENRVSALRNTDFFVPLALSPTSRTKHGFRWGTSDSLTYIGPSGSQEVYTSPLAYAYAVKSNFTFFFTGVEASRLPLQTCVSSKVPKLFSFSDWDDFPLYPENMGANGNMLMPRVNIPFCEKQGILSEPYGGKTPTASQAALIGSTTTAELSSLAPSTFAQFFSTLQDGIDSSDTFFVFKKALYLLLSLGTNVLYKLADRKLTLGVCPQKHNCGINDALLSHLGIPDDNALGTSIGQYQTIDNKDLSTTLKAIVTVHNADSVSNRGFLSYFNNTFNQGVTPGQYIWPTFPEGPAVSPRQSSQLFDRYLDQQMFNAMLVPVAGSIVSTVRLKVQTIDNPAFHVQAGQTIDLLVLDVRGTGIEADLNGEIAIALGEVARNISLSTELQAIVSDFAT